VKEVFRHADTALIGLYQSILEDAGILTFVRNANTHQALVAGLLAAIFPLPLFFPTLCVIDDVDYPEAVRILRSIRESASPKADEWRCTQCGETVPGNFTSCWNCQMPPSDTDDVPSGVS